jgi:HEAT repeat protein
MQSLEQLVEDLLSGEDHRAEDSARLFPVYLDRGVQTLLEIYKHPEADHRWWALRALACFPAEDFPQAAECLIKGLNDTDLSVQNCAAVGLREQPTPAAVPHLVALLEHDDKLLARLAGDALAVLEKEASPALSEFIKHQGQNHSNGKVEAVRALALIRDPASISTLFHVWENGSSMVRHWAERGLNDMGIGMAFFDPGG